MDPEQEAMIRDYMDLAQSLAMKTWRKAPHALELDELRAIAYYGLTMAAGRWRPYCEENGYSPDAMQYFRPFVVQRVHGALIDEIRARDWATRSLRTKAKALQRAGQDEGVSHEELAQRAGMTLAEVRATVRGMAQRPISLEAEELDPEHSTDVESSAFTSGVLTVVASAIETLPVEQQVVVALHYYRGLQLQEIARSMGITESRASQLHAKAVLTIHDAMVVAATQNEE